MFAENFTELFFFLSHKTIFFPIHLRVFLFFEKTPFLCKSESTQPVPTFWISSTKNGLVDNVQLPEKSIAFL